MYQKYTSLNAMKHLDQDVSLSVCERRANAAGKDFFEILMKNNFSVEGFVSKENTTEEIKNIIETHIPYALKNDPFYMCWIEDMAAICHIFCDLQDADEVCFWLGTKRGCKRFHVDYVPMRLLVTYAGYGTEWLPHDASDWDAYQNGGTNNEICKDPSQIQTLQPWDVAIFRGMEKGLLHKTPDHAICCPSIFMRLDNADHKKKLQRINDMR